MLMRFSRSVAVSSRLLLTRAPKALVASNVTSLRFLSTQERKQTADPEFHFIPTEDLEQEAKLRSDERMKVKKEHEEDAKHWTYPISYATKEEVQRHAKIDAQHRAESAQAEMEIPDEHHFIPPNILQKEIDQREMRRMEAKKRHEEDAKHWTYPISYATEEEIQRHAKIDAQHRAESAEEESKVPDEHHSIPPDILEKEMSHRDAINQARKYEPEFHIFPEKDDEHKEIHQAHENESSDFQYIPKEDLELEAARRDELRSQKKKAARVRKEYAKVLSHPFIYVTEEQIEEHGSTQTEHEKTKAKEDEIRHHAWE